MRRKEDKRPGREQLKLRIPLVIPRFYRSVAPRGGPRFAGRHSAGGAHYKHTSRNRRRWARWRLGDPILGEVARCEVGDGAWEMKATRLSKQWINKTRIATGGSVVRFPTTLGLKVMAREFQKISRIGASIANSLRNFLFVRPEFPDFSTGPR